MSASRIHELRERAGGCTRQQFAIHMDRLLTYGRNYNIKVADREKLVDEYLLALRDVPSDLLGRALDAILSEWKWGNRLPMAAEIRTYIDAAEILRRQQDLRSAQGTNPDVLRVQVLNEMLDPKYRDKGARIMADFYGGDTQAKKTVRACDSLIETRRSIGDVDLATGRALERSRGR